MNREMINNQTLSILEYVFKKENFENFDKDKSEKEDLKVIEDEGEE